MSNRASQFTKQQKRQQALRLAAVQIKVSVGLLVNSMCQVVGGPESAFSRLMDARLPATVSFHLTRISKACAVEVASYNDARQKLREKYATRTPAGELKKYEEWPTDKQAGFDKEHAELFAAEVMIPLHAVNLSSIASANISGSDLMLLDWLIMDDE